MWRCRGRRGVPCGWVTMTTTRTTWTLSWEAAPAAVAAAAAEAAAAPLGARWASPPPVSAGAPTGLPLPLRSHLRPGPPPTSPVARGVSGCGCIGSTCRSSSGRAGARCRAKQESQHGERVSVTVRPPPPAAVAPAAAPAVLAAAPAAAAALGCAPTRGPSRSSYWAICLPAAEPRSSASAVQGPTTAWPGRCARLWRRWRPPAHLPPRSGQGYRSWSWLCGAAAPLRPAPPRPRPPPRPPPPRGAGAGSAACSSASPWPRSSSASPCTSSGTRRFWHILI
mmetsp:Transcript_26557/g.85961  ORF Transcript_26557/g.85961 Transcript_26557/m.85961 type:complete len:281 (+) Transcript_26557:2080-2922(+)